MRNNKPTQGFTLIEVLIVLVIVAIITAVAVIAFGQFGRGRRERIIAEQFVQTITIAQQQAILTPEILGLGISASGYQFYQFEVSPDEKSGGWVTLGNDVLSRATGFKNVFRVDVKSIPTFSPAIKNNSAKPAIVFLSSGFVTPFVLELTGDAHVYTITVKNNGVAQMHIEDKAR